MDDEFLIMQIDTVIATGSSSHLVVNFICKYIVKLKNPTEQIYIDIIKEFYNYKGSKHYCSKLLKACNFITTNMLSIVCHRDCDGLLYDEVIKDRNYSNDELLQLLEIYEKVSNFNGNMQKIRKDLINKMENKNEIIWLKIIDINITYILFSDIITLNMCEKLINSNYFNNVIINGFDMKKIKNYKQCYNTILNNLNDENLENNINFFDESNIAIQGLLTKRMDKIKSTKKSTGSWF